MKLDNFEVMFRLPFLDYYMELIVLGEGMYFFFFSLFFTVINFGLMTLKASKSVLF